MEEEKTLTGKKLLVIGGAFQHCKVVKAAHRLGAVVYVVDYLEVEQSPAKQIADASFKIDIFDIDALTELCIREKIDGVISCALDPCQRPYQQLCERLGLPCFGTKEQFFQLTDKNAFKKCCLEHGVDVIPSYTEEDILAGNVQYPILIKPSDSRGSRGQSVCRSREEAIPAIDFAKRESSNSEVVIEKYMGGKQDFSMTCLMINGKAYLTRTGNRFLGAVQDGLDKVCIACVSPSVFTGMYAEKAWERVVRMLKDIGLSTAPVFMQGFVDGDTVRFYDPGLRFSGGEYEEMYEFATGFNPVLPLVEFALTGKVSGDCSGMENAVTLNGKLAVDLLVALRPGKVAAIKGVEEIRRHPAFVTMFSKIAVGQTVSPTHNVKQRFCEIDLVTDTKEEMRRAITWIYHTLRVEDEHGENMVTSRLDVNLI